MAGKRKGLGPWRAWYVIIDTQGRSWRAAREPFGALAPGLSVVTVQARSADEAMSLAEERDTAIRNMNRR